ncbi:DUF1877 family protein [Agrococcus beijingensis]|uniref:DUF1877 family protein n=1 Tax=Agrococcus beijingensis TaxID=3068634 RepID=UPI002740BD16|nr:DUF1877 family protein [Agrococcus sp. REN33]
MGIRYYAYAFEPERTEQALADPRSIISSDPLADAWGLPHGWRVGTTTDFRQSVPEADMLYLDKAWSDLQTATGPGEDGSPARPAFRMFEGRVRQTYEGWEAWVRALTPQDVREIVVDLDELDDDAVRARLSGRARYEAEPGHEADYALSHLQRAREFVAGLVADGRGMAYLIG